ncbi:MAG: hypothetical protein JRH08_03120 [Deltaproteobacteria bacterium]|nr:hypothetical protein [Deltaproteobacteria bacterium]MBW1929691.1 hypothetical protein [Deltaproteobacteria bacterium]MBW2023981.1 hypothetical protein [Deltaproteobacteria bacterium]MBW2124692.1 hypothetical protein [Deltaproteobacteria bacterium]RLB17408.1 MAG: hypothetical protein DRG63_03830 [Deltaproteobacteria bacterium]
MSIEVRNQCSLVLGSGLQPCPSEAGRGTTGLEAINRVMYQGHVANLWIQMRRSSYGGLQ